MRNWNNIFIKLELVSDSVMEFGNDGIKTKNTTDASSG
jgi:hypothetical protein